MTMVMMAVSKEGSAQPLGKPPSGPSASSNGGKKTGILTSWLSGRQFRTWKSIEKIVFARDKSGRLLHPTLHALWQRAEESGYEIHIDMPQPKGDSPYRAGNFAVEKSDLGDERPMGVIRIYLQAIDSASTSDQARRSDGFKPFEGLPKKNLRYAEVLGHELVHALLTLTDTDHAQLCRQMDSEVEELELHRRARNGKPLDDEARARLDRIRAMSEGVERRAEAVEVEIWRELSAIRGKLRMALR